MIIKKNKEYYDQKWKGRITDLKAPLLNFNLGGKTIPDEDIIRLRDAVRGIQVFGGIGSGKSSGSGKTIALTYLKSGFGGIVLTGKKDEAEEWKKFAKMTGREEDLIIFEKDSPYFFNFLQYETQRSGEGAGETINLKELIMSVYQMGQSFTSGGGGGGANEQFWNNALGRLISRIIDLLKFAEEEVSFFNMRNVMVSAFNKDEAKNYQGLLNALRKPGIPEEERKQHAVYLQNWIENNYCLQCLDKAYKLQQKSSQQTRLFGFIQDYFLKRLPKMPEKTRGTVEEMLLGLVEPFMSGILEKHFTEGVSKAIYPEQTFEEGKIIIINFPVKEYLLAGVFAQAIYKKLWQECVERRDTSNNKLPVFMWVDEAQYFLNEGDARFQMTARSSRACTVLITQNISNYYSAIGGKSPRDQVNSLQANIGTKIFHFNNDHVTNSWAAETIGKTFRLNHSTNTSLDSMTGSTNMSESLNFQIEPQQFTIMKGGGEENNFLVEAVITVAGKQWSNGKNFITTTFDQNFTV